MHKTGFFFGILCTALKIYFYKNQINFRLCYWPKYKYNSKEFFRVVLTVLKPDTTFL